MSYAAPRPPRPHTSDIRQARGDAGNVAVLFALLLPVVVGAAGLGVETTYWYFEDLKLQRAADAAAYAGAMEKRSGSKDEQVREMALQAAAENGFPTGFSLAEVNAPPLSGPSAGGDAVEVVLRGPAERFFTLLFSKDQLDLSARAVAVFNNASNACVIALHPSASRAAQFSGSSKLTLQGCSIMANSIAPDAVYAQGAAQMSADCLISGGGVTLTSGVSLTECKAPVTQAPPVADPFADLPVAPTGSCSNPNKNPLKPGHYCSGLDIKSAVSMEPGVYTVSGPLKVNAGATLSGTGVSIHLKGSGRASFNGNATLRLSAPTSGPYSGVLLTGDRASTGGKNTFNGTADSELTGAIYFPSQPVQYAGNFSGQGGCTQVVASTIEWTGNTAVSADCTSLGMRNLPVLSLVKLSE